MTQIEQTLGRYQIVREIARSNDVVYEAMDPTMNRRVAVKELALTSSLVGTARRQRIERFYREARAAGAMSHPNIVTIYEVGEDNGRYFIAMEFLEGGTLREKLSLSGALPLSEALAIGIALCDALEYAHNHGIVHRDIKPDNVHLLPGGRVKLTDFGIARITHEEQLTIAGQVFGTPSYMSPEQILGGPIDARTDIFSMGVLLYEMTTGRKPFTQPGDSVITITYRITNDPPPLPTGVPTNIEAAFARALSKNPEDRFASAADLRTALLAAAASVTGGFSTTYPGAGVRSNTNVPPQATLQYGAQTQMGVAPGLAAAALPPQGPPAQAAPFPEVSASYSSRDSFSREERGRRIALTLVTMVIGIGTLLIGGWGLSRAYENYQGQMSIAQVAGEYKSATALYTSGQFEQAAEAFRRLRTSRSSSAEIVTKATQGEVYSYRQLAHAAQNRNDFPSAVRWYREALKLTPNDSQVLAELEGAERRIPGGGGAQANGKDAAAKDAVDPNNPLASVIAPSSQPGAVQTPGAVLPSALPTISSSSYAASNAQAASEADAFFQQGEAAYRQGNGTAALRYWSAAVAAGPGTPAALRAQERISQTNSTTSPY